MAKECLWYNGETSHYELLEFEPDELTDDEIIEKAKAELTKKYTMNEEDFKKAKETLYVIDVDNLRKVGKEDIKSIPERISKLIEGKSEATIKEIFEEARNLEAEKARKQAILDYMDEYRAYVKSCVEDPDFDLTTMEDFDTWVQEEKDEEKIRCKKCGSFNTEKRGKEKYCTDCGHEDEITPDNRANW